VRRPKKPGFAVTVYRRMAYGGKVVEEVVSRDRYRPLAEKKPAPKPTPAPVPKPTPAPPPPAQPVAVAPEGAAAAE